MISVAVKSSSLCSVTLASIALFTFSGMGTASAEYVSGADRAPAVCKSSWKATHPDYSISIWGEDTADTLKKRQAMALEGTKAQYVSVTVDAEKIAPGAKPAILARKGEPLLLISCFQDRTFEAMTLDLHLRREIPQKVLDAAPASFVFPEEATNWQFNPALAYKMATEEDFAAVPGSHELLEKRSRCVDSGIGACQAAEKKVAAGPNFEQRRTQACSDARGKAEDKCFSGKLKADYEAKAKKLDELERKKASTFSEELKVKLQKK